MSRIRVELTEEEVARVKGWAEARGGPKESWGTTMRWQKDGNYHFHGMLGEYAYAKHYNVAVDTEVTYLGDGGIDLKVLGQTVDVKTVNYDPAILKLNSIRDFNSDMMALALRNTDNEIYLCGFTDLRHAIQQCYSRDFGHGKRLCLDEGHLYF